MQREGQDADATLSVDYTGVVPVVVEAIKEQQVLIELQRTKLEALEGRLARLERALEPS